MSRATATPVDGSKLDRGLVIMRASRLEALVSPMVELLGATRPDNVLGAQTIVAAHPGMKKWLQGELARDRGMGGIAANLEVILPSVWIDRLAQHQLGQKAISLPHYQQRHLRWTIHELLGDQLAAIGVSDVRVTSYLRDDGDHAQAADRARRRFQLADRLARIYSQYLVYRPDWLRGWEQGKRDPATHGVSDPATLATERELLAPLWKQLHTKLGPHRGDVVGELINRLENDDGGSGDALHVFGVSHLAPSELAVLRAFARKRLVALYVPDPCREYWGGLGRDRTTLPAYRDDELARIEAAGERDYWVDQDHPLLARWGRMGQHFMLALSDGQSEVLEDVRHWHDEANNRPVDRLDRLQQSIRRLDPGLLNVDLQANADDESEDASLRIHSCHTRLRELEVLRDQILDAIERADADGKPIKPSDIVVMAPNIQAYAPLIPAVFGVPGSERETLPYHLADVAIARSHSLFAAFQRLLDLPGTRVTAPEVIDLLSVPEVSRRLGLDIGALDELAGWLRKSRVAWALDGPFRERFGVPGIAEHTFAWALDRMIAGYLMADAASDDRQPAVRLADQCELAPLTGIDGPGAESLGALDRLLQEIQTLCDLADQTLRASVWASELETRFEALFAVDPMDGEAREAAAFVLKFIRGIASEPKAAGEDPELHFSVVRDLLAERLESVPERQRFLMGGITFCGMVPQRAIPFKVVALLGLNDGEFPRSSSDAGLDLMNRFRRLGDRDVRSDDRYLFLETVMSARQRLHLSYIGQGVRDGKSRNPAPPLAELLAALDDSAGLGSDEESMRPWLVHHPLQAFDRRYFDRSDSRLFSYNARYAAMHGRGIETGLLPFYDQANTRSIDIEPPIPLRQVQAYFKDPARQVLDSRMQIRLGALDDDRLPEDEPIEPRFEAIDSIARTLFFDVLARRATGKSISLDVIPTWIRLSGRMPPGRAGVAAWHKEKSACEALLTILDESAAFANGMPAARGHDIDLLIEGLRISGRIEHVFVSEGEWRLLRVFPNSKDERKPMKSEGDLNFKERIPMFLDWALLRLQTAEKQGVPLAIRMTALVAGETQWLGQFDRWDRAWLVADAPEQETLLLELRQRVVALLDFWRGAQSKPTWYFPRTSWQTVKSMARGDNDGSVGSAWASTQGGIGERDYAPGYARLLAGDIDFSDDSSEHTELITTARQLNAWIDLDSAPDPQS